MIQSVKDVLCVGICAIMLVALFGQFSSCTEKANIENTKQSIVRAQLIAHCLESGHSIIECNLVK